MNAKQFTIIKVINPSVLAKNINSMISNPLIILSYTDDVLRNIYLNIIKQKT